jgi:isopentenyl-diphosphate delta-isomerase
MAEERIVLLDSLGNAVGTAPKISSHHTDTPYHLAFSCYLVDDSGRVLITRRAHDKRTFPSVWTNSACGHPAPGEGLRDAVARRLDAELGIGRPAEFTLVLPDFSYRATAADGTVEHELCPVVRARYTGPARPAAVEVASADWRSWKQCLALVEDPGSSPWYRMQMARLTPLGDPLDWPAADTALLPPALSW